MKSTDRIHLQRAAAAFAAIVFVCLLPRLALSERLPLRAYTSADNLATSVIHGAMRDSEGFLWFAGRGGLSRFDGYEFISYRFSDEESAPLVHRVLETRDGRYFWILSDNGLYRVERRAEELARPRDASSAARRAVRRLPALKVSNNAFWAIHETPSGELLVGTNNAFFAVEDKEAERVSFRELTFSRTAKAEKRGDVRDFADAPDGSLWLASTTGMIRRMPDGRFLTYEIPRIADLGEEVYTIRVDQAGRVWATFRSGVFVLAPEPAEAIGDLPDLTSRQLPFAEFKPGAGGEMPLPDEPGELLKLDFNERAERAGQAINASVWDLYQSADGRLWIPTLNGLYIVDGGKYRRLRDATSLPGITSRIIEDGAGNLWFGTFGGLIKYTRGGLTTYNQMSGLPDANVHLIGETPDGKLFVSHGTWRVSLLGPEGFTTHQLNLPENARISWTSFPVVPDRGGALWSLQTGALFRFPHRGDFAAQAAQTPEDVFKGQENLKNKVFYRAFVDRRGDFWLSVNSTEASQKTLMKYSPATGAWIDLANAEGFPKGRTFASFAEDAQGHLWFGFSGSSGVAKYSDGRFRLFTTADGLPSGSTFGLHVDRRGRLWITSNEKGLTRVDDTAAERPEFVRITENEGLASDNLRCLTEDLEGNIYAGTVRGVTKIDAESGRTQHITTADGLAADFVQTAFRDSSGVLWFGTSNGISRYEPTARRTPPPPRAFISDLEIAGVRYSVSEFGQQKIGGIEAASTENNLQIDFFSVGEAGSLRYQFMLEGAENAEWSAPAEQRTVNFANLAPGDYRFLVRAVNPSGQASPAPAEVSFRILPPFWQRWWFIALAALVVAGLIFALDRYRVAKTRQVEMALRRSQESETRFRTLAETASDAILTIDSESTIVFINPALEKIFGHTAAEMIGQKLTILMPEDFRSKHDAGLERYLATSRKNTPWSGVELPGRHRDGHEIPLEVSFGEFERDGRRYFTGIIRDISERRRAEEALRRSREERLRELERVRTRIATDLHDDIGSSLTQIAVLSEVARNQAAQLRHEPISMPLERIKSVSRELVEAMSDVVWAINPQKDNLRDLVQRMRRFASDVCSGRSIHFELNAPSVETSLQLGANVRREVFAIFKESINNAVKYAEATRITADFRIESETLVLQISDDGHGFDMDEILSENFSPEKGGNGLINMRRRAAELGGACRIISFPSGGTSILLEVPLHGPENGAAAPASMGGDNGHQTRL